jgi:hypothetical protein
MAADIRLCRAKRRSISLHHARRCRCRRAIVIRPASRIHSNASRALYISQIAGYFLSHGLDSLAILTTLKIIYLPVSPTPTLQSFAVPILNVTDSRVTAPWFGANKWEALIQPVSGGGIPSQHAELDMVMEFKEGGAFDFASTFERLKERLRQAVDVARESGADAEDGGRGINMNNVHLEDLPAYEESGTHTRVAEPVPSERTESAAMPAPQPTSPRQRASPVPSPQAANFQPPLEPPPGYEEAQRDSIVDELERQVRRMSND